MQIVPRRARRVFHLHYGKKMRLRPFKKAAHRRYRCRCRTAIKIWLHSASELDEDLDFSFRYREALTSHQFD